MEEQPSQRQILTDLEKGKKKVLAIGLAIGKVHIQYQPDRLNLLLLLN